MARPSRFVARSRHRKLGRRRSSTPHSRPAPSGAESTLRLLAAYSSDVICHVSADGTLLYVSPSCRELLGYSSDEMVGTNGFGNIHPEDRDRIIAATNSTAGLAEPLPLEYRLRRKDGRYVWVEASLRRLLDQTDSDHGSGDSESLVVVVRNIQHRKDAEQDRALLAAIVRSTHDAVIGKSLDGTIQTWNAAAARMYGYSAGEIIGQPAHVLSRRGEAEEMRKLLATVRTGRRIEDFRTVHRTRSGRDLYVSLSVSPVTEPSGNIIGIAATVRDVGNQREIEQILRRSEERYRAIFNSASIGVAVHDLQGKWLAINDTGCRILGRTRHEVMQTAVDDLMLPEDARSMKSRIAQVIAGEVDAFESESRYLRKDGAIAWVDISVSPIRETDGSPVATLAVLKDITDRKRAEVALQQSESLLQEAGRLAQVGGWEYDVELGRPVWSAQVCRIHELPLGHQPTTDEAVEFYAPEARPIIRQAVIDAVEKGEPFDLELPVITAKGRHRWVHAIGRPQVENGRVARVTGVFQDITERKRAEQALVQSEKQYRLLFEMESDALFMVERDSGRILMANAAAAGMYGYSREVLQRMNFADLSAEAEKTHKITQEEYASVVPRHFHRKRNGSVFPVEIAVRTFLWEGRMVCLASVRDITRRLANERSLCAAKEQAEAANRAKSEFLANISHEIRTPMTAILGFADLLAQPGLPRHVVRQHVATIRNNGQTLLRLLNDILDLSRIEAGKIDIQEDLVSLPMAIDEVLSVVLSELQRKQLRIRINYESGLPSIVCTDAVRFRQILVNLMGNAVKFTDEGSITVTCSLHAADRESRTIAISIADTGVGIGSDQIGAIFEPFTQGDSSHSRRFGGTGLGLAVSRRLARMLGGDIAVDSQPERGSTFRLTLPAPELNSIAPERIRNAIGRILWPSQAGGEPPDDESFQPAAIRLRGRLLLAEDVVDIQRLLASVLAKLGLSVDIAPNGRVACEMVHRAEREQRPYDVVLMDMQMPEMNGYEATAWLRQNGWNGPIVALTAHAMSGDEQKCKAAGCNEYLAKPIRLDELVSCLTRQVGDQIVDA